MREDLRGWLLNELEVKDEIEVKFNGWFGKDCAKSKLDELFDNEQNDRESWLL